MAKKCKCPPAGAPDWVMTYGDMMSLLLTFFILLASLSEIKNEDVWRARVEVVKQSFGMHGGGGHVPTQDDPTLSLVQRLEKLYLQQERHRRTAVVDDAAVHGRQPRVSQSRNDLRRGLGSVVFEPGSAQLSEVSKQQLAAVARLIQGYNNKIELQGHASSSELGAESDYPDLWTLSYARAKAVMDYMVDDLGIRRERIRLLANADNEPMKKKEYDTRALGPNRRVNIEISDRLVDEFTKPLPE